MLAIVFVVSCLLACGFYVYVLVQLRREQKRMSEPEKRLPEHFYPMGQESRELATKSAKLPGS